MTNQLLKPSVKFTYETNYHFAALRTLRKAIVSYNPTTRQVTADIIKSHGFEAHTGGHHVAVMQSGVRLAMVTSATLADFK